ncbi:hypothetical protein EaACW_1407 [Erwinia amylovora ACW56400]|uniref:Uncharacterized protein n=3 Tax=Erwinia amylovora TaxID=552 RepID=A0A831EJK0_ERWAM|nr:hypothetical protein EaACW_1407 [Erwinia amylovora ACW56400]CBA20349.1 hypothetical protein predicted by Glimmer/Critica [Erwinia amylovora CFBP1430]CBX80261.1 hypothetical protein predicted by Glimmer/Critica [Erwinia amylovora ATCC BAA-2158]CCO78255.1 hypothetical protein BN432_1446 [Erwinia amylovora Ea356]CCO82044.1 hypothetical protein BN433_1461 [Erwinia amylovora Ea266]CCO85840.1 hypothetical protein BN434_1441 [Erwinia amylovora CFBP 2585]CCO89627.1 hypothetical protein BN435_1444 
MRIARYFFAIKPHFLASPLLARAKFTFLLQQK